MYVYVYVCVSRYSCVNLHIIYTSADACIQCVASVAINFVAPQLPN